MDLPLHSGKAPRWLFERMKRLGGAIVEIIVMEYGTGEMVKRLADPLWFQALSCALGFDWHSSGTTTVTMGAIKEALKERELGIKVAGGKGRGRKTLEEIEKFGEEMGIRSSRVEELKLKSRLSAKVDNAALLDGFSIYHHTIAFDEKGKWVVVQQGMREDWARRYHLSNVKSFEEEPNSGIVSDKRVKPINLVAKESKEARKAVVDAFNDRKILSYANGQATLFGPVLKMPKSHVFSKRIYEQMLKIYESSPRNLEEVLLAGAGPKTMRAVTLLAELIYDVKTSRRDPVKFSFAHGGKDGIPYPVNKRTYDRSIQILLDAIENAKLGKREKIRALERLGRWAGKV